MQVKITSSENGVAELYKSRDWQECAAEEGERRVMEKGSLFVQGIAGTGKTTFCQGIVERLTAGRR